MENKKTIATIGMVLLSLSFCLCLYGGETTYYDLSNEIENLQNFTCNITAENYDLDGLNFTTNDTGFTITTQTNYMPDNLTINCLLNGIHYVQESSGGSSSNYISNTKLQNGYQETLRENKKVSFKLGSSSHSFTLNKIYDTYAEFTMRSNPITFNLSEGDCKVIELEEQVKVCLLELNNRDADFSIQKGNFTIEEPIINETTENNSVNINLPLIEPKEEISEEKNNKIFIIALISFVILSAILLFLKFKKRENLNNL